MVGEASMNIGRVDGGSERSRSRARLKEAAIKRSERWDQDITLYPRWLYLGALAIPNDGVPGAAHTLGLRLPLETNDE